MHSFGLRRVREHRTHQLLPGCFELSPDRIALDHLGHFVPAHVRAQQFARIGKHFYEALDCARGQRFAVRRERKAADPHRSPGRTRLLLVDTNARDLRMAGRARRNPVRVERMRVKPAMCSTHDTPS